MADDPRIGTQIAGYRIERRLGRGGMGLVYLAEHLHLQRMVALKLLAPEVAGTEGFRERFLRESRMAASLQHPNIVTVYDAGEVDDSLFIAMQYVEGTDLATVLDRDGALAPERALDLLGQVASALDAAHAGGLVHRDVKPANVLLDPARAYLTDFGLTRRTDSKSGFTKTGQFLGTIDYSAPEQIEGRDLDGRTDVYALGCVLYECLTGERPYARDSDLAVIYAHIQADPPSLAERRPELSAVDPVIARALAKRKEERWTSCTEMISAARAAAPSAPAQQVVTQPSPKPPPVVTRVAETEEAPRPAPPTDVLPGVGAPVRRLPVVPLAIAAGVAALAVAGVLLLSGGGDGGDGGAGGDRAAGTVAGTFPVGERPFGVAVEGDDVYVVGQSDNSVTRLRRDGSGATTQSVGAGPFWASVGESYIWVTNRDGNSVSRLARDDLTPQSPIPVGSAPYFIAIRDGTVWVVNGDDNSVSRLDETSGEPLGPPVAVGSSPRGIAIGEGSVWVANSEDDSVTRIDAGSGEVVGDPIPVGTHPIGVSAGDGAVWVANEGDDSVTRIDARTGQPDGDAIAAGNEPFDVAYGDGTLWVANAADDTVTRVDGETGRVVGTLRVGNQPTGITEDGGLVWVALNDDNAVQRIEP